MNGLPSNDLASITWRVWFETDDECADNENVVARINRVEMFEKSRRVAHRSCRWYWL